MLKIISNFFSLTLIDFLLIINVTLTIIHANLINVVDDVEIKRIKRVIWIKYLTKLRIKWWLK